MNRFEQIINYSTDGKGKECDHSNAHTVATLYLLSQLYEAGAIAYRASPGQCLWDEYVLQLQAVHPYFAGVVGQKNPGGPLARQLT